MAPDSPPVMPGRAQNGRTLRCSWHPFSKEAGRRGKAEGPDMIFASPTFHEGPSFHQPDGWVGGLDLAEPAPPPALTAADRNQSGSCWPEITAPSRREETEGMGVGGQREGGKAGSSPCCEATRCHPHHPALRTPAYAHPGGGFGAKRNRLNARGRAGSVRIPFPASWPLGPGQGCVPCSLFCRNGWDQPPCEIVATAWASP